MQSFKNQVAAQRLWSSAAFSELTETVHRYKNISWETEVVPRGIKDQLPARMFVAQATANKGLYHSVASEKQASGVRREDWEAAMFEWWSPALFRAHTGQWPSGGLVLARMVGSPDSLLRISAKGSFFEIGVTGLQQLAKHLGCALARGQGLAASIKVLVALVLGPQSDEAIISILALRLKAKTEHLDLMKTTEMSELLSADDLKAVQQAELEQNQKEATQEDFRQEVRALRAKISEAAGRGSRGRRVVECATQAVAPAPVSGEGAGAVRCMDGVRCTGAPAAREPGIAGHEQPAVAC